MVIVRKTCVVHDTASAGAGPSPAPWALHVNAGNMDPAQNRGGGEKAVGTLRALLKAHPTSVVSVLCRKLRSIAPAMAKTANV